MCNHPPENLTLQPEMGTNSLNIYQCACGALGYRSWSRSKGLAPFQPFANAEDRKAQHRKALAAQEARFLERMQNRDRKEERVAGLEPA